MNVLIVHAHPEPKSFNTAMTQRAVATLRAAGHDPVVSDLYAMGFDPISDRRNFTTVADKVILNIQNEELFAVQHSGFTPLLKAEMDKLVACDLLIFQFPIWWLSLPAILKGWVDRVFACGVAYGGGRYFDGGAMRGRRAMCALTLGGGQQVYSDQGFYAGLEAVLFPIHHGVFGFAGFDVIEPFAVYGPSRMSDAERADALDRYAERLLGLDRARILPMPKTAEYKNGVRIMAGSE